MEMLLDRRGDQITITKDIVKAAVQSLRMMMLLFERRGDEITITEDIVEAAAATGNRRYNGICYF